MTERLPDTRTRVNFVQNAKGEWRVAEITVELTNHPSPTDETFRLFHHMRTVGEHDCECLNAANRDAERFS